METSEKRNVPDDDVIDLREIFFAIKRKIFLYYCSRIAGKLSVWRIYGFFN